MLVGHLPHMSRLASLLLKGDAEKNAVNFKQGSVVCLENPGDGNFSVEWMVTPELVPGVMSLKGLSWNKDYIQ